MTQTTPTAARFPTTRLCRTTGLCRTAGLLALCLALLAAPVRAGDLEEELFSAELGRRYDAELFQRAVGSDSPLVRAAAARAAGGIKDERAHAWLLPLLHDDAGRVRRAALFALGQIGGDGAVISLRESLPGLPRSDAPHALEALGKTKDPRAVATVAGYLKSSEPAIRGAAALALFRLGDASALPELFAALLAENEPEARWREVYAIARLLRGKARTAKGPVTGDKLWTPPLVAATRLDRPFHERCFAARALGALKGHDARLLELTRDDDPRVVIAAIRGLATDTSATHGAGVVYLAAHADDLVREAAIDALVGWGEKNTLTLKVLAPTLRGRSQMRVHIALAKAGQDVGAFDSAGDSALAEEYAWSMAPYAKGKPLPPHEKLTSIAGMRAAAEACGAKEVPADAALPVLRRLLTANDYTVQTMAIVTMADRGLKGETERIVKAARATTDPSWIDVRIEAANALAKMKVYDPWLDEAARDPERVLADACRAALEALERPLPPRPPRAGYQLYGKSAPEILKASRALAGARVQLRTNRGTMTMVLLPDQAPAHCVNFAKLVSSGFYDGKRWHRVVADFVIQGGCPRGDGWGGPGYFLPDEIGMRPYVRGTVGMPRSGNDTGGCQIFITHLPTPHLDGNYSVYAQVIEGLEVIDKIRVGDTIEKATLIVR